MVNPDQPDNAVFDIVRDEDIIIQVGNETSDNETSDNETSDYEISDDEAIDDETILAFEQMVNPDQPDDAVFDIVRDGDMIIEVGTEETKLRLLRVSSQALKERSKYYRALLGPNWGLADKTFTVSSPLIVDEDYDIGFVLFMLILHAVPLSDPKAQYKIKLKYLRKLAVLVDFYKYDGEIPTYITRRLENRLAENCVPVLAIHALLLDILAISYLLNIADLFTKVSTQVMWCLKSRELTGTISPEMLQLLPVDIFAEFDRESHRLRSSLVKSLPNVFYPVPYLHTTSRIARRRNIEVWCKKCNAVPHEQRWIQEVISKSWLWKDEQHRPLLHRIDQLFGSYLDDMQVMREREYGPVEGYQKHCSEFWPRYIDVRGNEILQDLMRAMGGVCIHCFRGGRFKYEVYCEQHGLYLT
ncbi:hypothetical protein LTS15_010962 [Exophiala xenobiotica]|nr:hypothetical protein LTS15_010962 [Exophiala xenobiotica]